MWTLASALLIAGALAASIGFAYAAGNIWADLRRGCFGVLAGNARWGIRLVLLGCLLSTIGLALGGLQDVVGLLAEQHTANKIYLRQPLTLVLISIVSDEEDARLLARGSLKLAALPVHERWDLRRLLEGLNALVQLAGLVTPALWDYPEWHAWQPVYMTSNLALRDGPWSEVAGTAVAYPDGANLSRFTLKKGETGCGTA